MNQADDGCSGRTGRGVEAVAALFVRQAGGLRWRKCDISFEKAVHHDLQTRPQLHVDNIKTPDVPLIFASLVYFQGLRKAVTQLQIDDVNWQIFPQTSEWITISQEAPSQVLTSCSALDPIFHWFQSRSLVLFLFFLHQVSPLNQGHKAMCCLQSENKGLPFSS